jgi:hypothetical protein
MTKNAYQSEWVQNELSRAKRKNKPIFPLLLNGDEPWLTVETTQYADVRDGSLPPIRFFSRLATFTLDNGLQAPRRNNFINKLISVLKDPNVVNFDIVDKKHSDYDMFAEYEEHDGDYLLDISCSFLSDVDIWDHVLNSRKRIRALGWEVEYYSENQDGSYDAFFSEEWPEIQEGATPGLEIGFRNFVNDDYKRKEFTQNVFILFTEVLKSDPNDLDVTDIFRE